MCSSGPAKPERFAARSGPWWRFSSHSPRLDRSKLSEVNGLDGQRTKHALVNVLLCLLCQKPCCL